MQQGRRALGICPRLVAGGFQPVDTILERRVVEIGNPTFDGVIEPLQA
ncbi:hypothetical protein [Sphingobium mellinum]